MLSKESKIRVLENFYALDYVFFGKPVSKVDTCCPLVKEEYLSVKGALMSVFVEMLKLVSHNPGTLTEAVDSKSLMKNARQAARIARENSQKIVTTTKARQNIKEALKEELQSNPNADVTAIVEKAIRTKAFGLAVDNLLIARSIHESADVSALDEWEGQIVEDSYKILRDSLIEAAYSMIHEEDDSKDDEEEDLDEFIDRDRGGSKGGFGSIGGKSTSGGFGTIAGRPIKKESEDSWMQQVLNKKKVKVNEGVYGALVGAVLGFLSPIPLGPLVGAAAGSVIEDWRKANTKKVENYCKERSKKGDIKYAECMQAGRRAILQKINMAKKQAKAKAKSKL